MKESKPTTDLDSVSVVGSVDASVDVTREDLLKELALPSCMRKPPVVKVSSRKGDVPDTVERKFYLGDGKRRSIIDQPPEKEPEEPSLALVPSLPTPVETPPEPEERIERTQPELLGPEDFAAPQPKSVEPVWSEVDTPYPEPEVESKVDTIQPAEETQDEIIFSKIDTPPPTPKDKANLQTQGNFELDIETEVTLGFNPYSNLCASLGFLVQGVHEEIRSLEGGNYQFKMHIEKVKDA